MSRRAFVLYLIAVLIASISQILLKVSANKNYSTSLEEYLNKFVVLGYGLFILSVIIATLALKDMEYKYGTIMESISYFFILLGSRVILKEKITTRKLIGVSIIISGIVIFMK